VPGAAVLATDLDKTQAGCQSAPMSNRGFHFRENLPALRNPLVIAGFEGWGNALNVASGMLAYLIEALGAEAIGSIDPDSFYRYDESRPVVHIEEGQLQRLTPPGGTLFAAKIAAGPRDLVLVQAQEPQLRWFQFARELCEWAAGVGGDTVISLGSMYDAVLHTDRLVSGIASDPPLGQRLRELGAGAVSYQGPSAIHSVIMDESRRRGIGCVSLWCHCPYYLQGATHFGVMCRLAELLARLGGFELDTGELETNWRKLDDHIRGLVEKNEDLQKLISGLRQQKRRGSFSGSGPPPRTDGKVINLLDFLDPH
jgi:predicted ATP-grasp superfamily ATP-dependent carboligase